MTNFNERTNTLLYKNIPLTLDSRKGCKRVDVGYVWEVNWRRAQTATCWPKVPLTIAALLFHLGWAAQLWFTEGPKPSVCRWLSLRHLVPNSLQLQMELELELTDWPKPSVAPGYIFVWHPPASCGRTHLPLSPNSTTSTGQGDIPMSSTGCTCFAVLPLIYTGASLDWRLSRGSIYSITTLQRCISIFCSPIDWATIICVLT